MKLTKYPQSCLFIESKGVKILIDPGQLLYEEEFLKMWKQADILLITHKHGDHCYPDAIKQLSPKQFFTSKEVADAYPSLKPNIVKTGDTVSYEGIEINVVKAVHGWMPRLRGGKEIDENIGFIIDDGKIKAYHTSDSVCFDNNYVCDVILIACNNHGLVTGPVETAAFAKDCDAKLVIPCHYHNDQLPADIEAVKRELEKADLKYLFPDIGETKYLDKAL